MTFSVLKTPTSMLTESDQDPATVKIAEKNSRRWWVLVHERVGGCLAEIFGKKSPKRGADFVSTLEFYKSRGFVIHVLPRVLPLSNFNNIRGKAVDFRLKKFHGTTCASRSTVFLEKGSAIPLLIYVPKIFPSLLVLKDIGQGR